MQDPVRRPRLSEALDQALSTRVTTVVAPAGYGKSVLIRDWLDQRSDIVSLYLALDERDNDAGRLWKALISGLSEQIPGMADGPGRIVNVISPGSMEVIAEAYCDVLTKDGRTVVVALDDAHLVKDPLTLDSIDLLQDEMPESVHLILAGRHDPRLPVSRLRVRGQLTEIREVDLRFTIDESAELISHASLKLEPTEIEALHQLTEGWVAALRLAVLAMQQGRDSFVELEERGDAERLISDYLLEEVLGHMDASHREFLLSTCVVDELNGELGTALSGLTDADSLLAKLFGGGVFTLPLAGQSGWYRYHRLLRDMLRVNLRTRTPDRFAELHRRAGDWHAEHDYPAVAVHHMILAGDIEEADRYLGDVAPKLVVGGLGKTVVDLSGRIMEQIDEPSALTLTTRVWALYQVGDPSEVLELGDRLEAALVALAQADPDAEDAIHGGTPSALASGASLPWLRGALARARGDVEALLRLDSPDAIPSPSGRVEAWLAEGLMWLERYSQATPLIDEYTAAVERDQYPPSLVHSLGLQSLNAMGMGDPGKAAELSSRGLGIAAEHGFGELIHTMYARLVATWAAWARGELNAAEDAAVGLQRFCEHAIDVPVIVQHAILRSRVRWSLGDAIGARSLLDRVTVTPTGQQVTGHFADRIALARAMLDLLDDEPESAERYLPDWRDRLVAGPATMRERLVLLRMAVATGEDVDSVHRPVPDDVHISPLDEMGLGCLRAIAYLKEGRSDHATDALATSLRTAERLGTMQSIVDDRRRLAPILSAAVRQSGVKMHALDEPGDEARTVYVEPLSPRELTVLEHMATHMSYPEIADELYVSPSTVRSHVKSIYRKLAVNRRSEAVSQGRAYGLIR